MLLDNEFLFWSSTVVWVSWPVCSLLWSPIEKGTLTIFKFVCILENEPLQFPALWREAIRGVSVSVLLGLIFSSRSHVNKTLMSYVVKAKTRTFRLSVPSCNVITSTWHCQANVRRRKKGIIGAGTLCWLSKAEPGTFSSNSIIRMNYVYYYELLFHFPVFVIWNSFKQ